MHTLRILRKNNSRTYSVVDSISIHSAVVEEDVQPAATTSPQCEHIVVQPVQSWGGADVTVQQLTDTIADVLSQVRFAGSRALSIISSVCMCYVSIQACLDNFNFLSKASSMFLCTYVHVHS